ncbi:hypothetical protein CP969_03925 [Streptomyces viridosporus T7A]|uniref:Lsr2 DNA-binding domain-containing protein n=1 Tax=Streptomyces viridosporus T7A TaxID=665577 RepID=A0ABX6A832_STRVD|nr:hypothetical protein CP969_03925 [Streptomyces viridosporus T7A]
MTDLAALTRLGPPPRADRGRPLGDLRRAPHRLPHSRPQRADPGPPVPAQPSRCPRPLHPLAPRPLETRTPCDVQPVGTATIRSWARANGYAVPSRGRVPRSGGSPRRTEPGARAVGRLAWTAEDSCQGTLVTVTPGMKSRRLLSQRAEWLWRRFSHQWPTTYSGTKTATTSWGPARRMERTYSTAGLVISR